MNAQKIRAQEIKEALLAAGVSLPVNADGQFAAYLELLLRWNARLNLTAIRSPEGILRRHFVECAFAARYLRLETGTVLDFGSGAGFPGIPMAICRPEITVTLAESQSRKAAFLSEALRVLGISGSVYRGRVEAMPVSQTFDAVAMRAVDKMHEAVSVARPHAKRTLVLMVTLAEAAGYRDLAPEFSWKNPILLPNSSKAIVLIGERRKAASRAVSQLV